MQNCALLALFLVPFAVGCGSSDESTSTKPTSEKPSNEAVAKTDENVAAVPTKPLKSSTPKEAVQTFLDAVKLGDAVAAELILTERARVEMGKNDMDVRPPQNPDAQYTLGATEYEDDAQTGAYVASSWTAEDKNGAIQTDEIVWILRNEDAGWRLAGMAVKPDPSKPPRIFNFENPLEMMTEIEEAEKDYVQEQQQTPPATATAAAPPETNANPTQQPAGTTTEPPIRQATKPAAPGTTTLPPR